MKNEPERTESFRIFLKINASDVSIAERKKLGKMLLPDSFFLEGDSINLTYNFDILYFGNIVKMFSLILDFFDRAAVRKANTQELTFGKSLVQEVLVKMEQIEQKFKENQDVKS